MSLLDSFEEHVFSPAKVAVNLASDVLTTGDLPSWDQIASSFNKSDTSTLPKVELTAKPQTSQLADSAMQFGSTSLSVQRTGDGWSFTPPPPPASVSFAHATAWKNAG